MKKKRTIKARYFVLAAILLAMAAGVAVYVVNVGHTYSIAQFFGDHETVDRDALTVTVSDESVLQYVSDEVVQGSDGAYYLRFTVKGLGSGSAVFRADYQIGELATMTAENHLLVLPFGVIYDMTLDTFTGYEIFIPFVISVFLAIIAVLGVSFFEKWRNGLFSYGMVGIGGVILYLFGNILIIVISYLLLGGREALPTFRSIFDLIVNSGPIFAMLTFPVLLLLAMAVSLSNIMLVRYEGFRPVNLLGIIFSVPVIGGFFLVYHISGLDMMYLNDWDWILHTAATAALSYSFCYFECMLLSTVLCAMLATRCKPRQEQDYLIILGCAIRRDGTPTPILRGRVDRALAFEREQFAATGRHAKFVPSGGQGSDEVISEAESMKRCLMEQGVPEEQILLEDKSVNTLQNMEFSKKVIEDDAGDLSKVNIAFSTTNYHVFRGYILAKKVGMAAKGLSARTRMYFYPNAFVREFIGLLYEEKLRHLAFLLITVGGYLAFSLLMSLKLFM